MRLESLTSLPRLGIASQTIFSLVRDLPRYAREAVTKLRDLRPRSDQPAPSGPSPRSVSGIRPSTQPDLDDDPLMPRSDSPLPLSGPGAGPPGEALAAKTVFEDIEAVDDDQIVTLEEVVDPAMLRALADPSLPSPLGDDDAWAKDAAVTRTLHLPSSDDLFDDATVRADDPASFDRPPASQSQSLPRPTPPAPTPPSEPSISLRSDAFLSATPAPPASARSSMHGFPVPPPPPSGSPPLPFPLPPVMAPIILGPAPAPPESERRPETLGGPPTPTFAPFSPFPQGAPPPSSRLDDPRTKTVIAFVTAFLVTLAVLLFVVFVALRTRR